MMHAGHRSEVETQHGWPVLTWDGRVLTWDGQRSPGMVTWDGRRSPGTVTWDGWHYLPGDNVAPLNATLHPTATKS